MNGVPSRQSEAISGCARDGRASRDADGGQPARWHATGRGATPSRLTAICRVCAVRPNVTEDISKPFSDSRGILSNFDKLGQNENVPVCQDLDSIQWGFVMVCS
jgi:hypothetical protein